VIALIIPTYLYPLYQQALVKGPFVHAVSLSTSPTSDEGTAAAQAKGAKVSRQKRSYNEAIIVE
jgi:hypothetical protein